MRAASFCPNCGEQIKAKRAGFLPFGPLCAGCAPRYRRARFALLAVLALAMGIVFAMGRFSAPREPFYFIGTPLDVNSAPGGAAANQSPAGAQSETANQSREQAAVTSTAIEMTCGAPTKSGRPCQRKVKGGGYCWQHRDKFKK